MTFSKSIFTFTTFTAWYLLSLVELEMSQPVLDNEMINHVIELKSFHQYPLQKTVCSTLLTCELLSPIIMCYNFQHLFCKYLNTPDFKNKLFFLAISDLTKGQTCTIDYFSSECPTDKQRTLCFFCCFFP